MGSSKVAVYSDFKNTTLSALELQSIGQQYYGQRDYVNALGAFTAALKCSGKDQFTVLDHRAATYEKLSRYPEALRDARRMIELKKSGAKGYLHAGKALQRIKKRDKAIDIYQYGLKNIKDDDPLRAILSAMVTQLSGGPSTKAATLIDPFTVLPTELVQLVMEGLPTKSRVTCLGVSRTWRDLLTSLTPIWKSVEIYGLRKRIRGWVVNAALHRAQSRPKRLRIDDGNEHVSIEHIKRAIEISAPNLHELVLNQCSSGWQPSVMKCRRLSVLVLTNSPGLSLNSVVMLLEVCPLLRHLRIHIDEGGDYKDYPTRENLHSLDIKHVKWPKQMRRPRADYPIPLNEFASRLPNLRRLRLQGLSIGVRHGDEIVDSHSVVVPELHTLRYLKELFVSESIISRFPSLPPSLEVLRMESYISSLSRGNTLSPNFWESFERSPLPMLRDLHLPVIHQIWNPDPSPRRIKRLLQYSHGKLESFRLSTGALINDAFMMQLVDEGFLCNLVHLTLESQDGKTTGDDLVEKIAGSCPHLQSFNASGGCLTGVGVKALVSQVKGLKRLNFSDCSRVSPDAVTWARSMGILIDTVRV